MFIFALTTCLLSASALAAPALASQDQLPVSIAMELELNGRIVAKPKLIVLMGEKGLFTQRTEGLGSSYSIQVRPELDEPGKIELAFVIKQLNGRASKTLSQPRIIVQNGKSALVEERTAGMPDLRLTATPSF
jgi:hypothetical protein